MIVSGDDKGEGRMGFCTEQGTFTNEVSHHSLQNVRSIMSRKWQPKMRTYPSLLITFNDVKEVTLISHHVHRNFLHSLLHLEKKCMKYVKMPTSLEKIRECEQAFRMAGFPGWISSTDGAVTRIQPTMRLSAFSRTTMALSWQPNHKHKN